MAQKGRQKKTQAQANQCKKALESQTLKVESTFTSDAPNLLKGTDEGFGKEGDIGTKPKKKEFKYAVGDWCKKNLATAIVLAIITGVGAYITNSLIQLNSDVKVIEVMISELQIDINKLETDAVSKENLDLQLSSIKESLNSKVELDVKEVQNQLELIKQQIEFIEKSKE